MAELANFYKIMKPISIHVREIEEADDLVPGKGRYSLLYTGGVDSVFSLVMNEARVDNLVTFKFFLDSDAERDRIAGKTPKIRRSNRIARNRGVGEFLYATEEFAWAWPSITHGPALISLGHQFGAGIENVLISSSYKYGALFPWGSHPLLDPLAALKINGVSHFGNKYSRFEKVFEIVKSGHSVLQNMKVCGERPSGKNGLANCSVCQKFRRTMVAFDLCDAKEATSGRFDWS